MNGCSYGDLVLDMDMEESEKMDKDHKLGSVRLGQVNSTQDGIWKGLNCDCITG